MKEFGGTVQPYLFFDGLCEEALEFYQKALGAEVLMLMRYGESPVPTPMRGFENKVMHASFRVGGTILYASDGQCAGKPNFQNFGLIVSTPTEEEANKLFGALTDGGGGSNAVGKDLLFSMFRNG